MTHVADDPTDQTTVRGTLAVEMIEKLRDRTLDEAFNAPLAAVKPMQPISRKHFALS